jgi:hypothetical protein
MSYSKDSTYDDPKNQKALKELILDLVHKKGLTDSLIDGSFLINQSRSDIEEVFKAINDSAIPCHLKDEQVNSRPLRGIDRELGRMTQEVCALYKEQFIPLIPEVIERLVSQGDSVKLNHFVDKFFYSIIMPLLSEQESPGDDIFLFVRYIMALDNDKTTNDILADRLSGPAYSLEAVYGICGLIIQAGRAKRNGLIDQAYSYLIDASNMLGMYKSAAFMRSRFEPVANSYFAKKHANKKHSSPSANSAAKEKVRKLFVSLRGSFDPENPESFPLWKNASEARKAISEVMCQEVEDGVIGDSTIYSLCKELQNQEKEAAERRARPAISVIVNQTLDDGTVVPRKLF